MGHPARNLLAAHGFLPTGTLEKMPAPSAIARLQHPNIVQIHEVGSHEHLPFFSLEYCAGGSLHRRLRETLLAGSRGNFGLVATLALAVHAAHQKGVLDRDLKPGNVLRAYGRWHAEDRRFRIGQAAR